MEEKPFPEFDLPLIAEASAGPTFGMMEELEERKSEQKAKVPFIGIVIVKYLRRQDDDSITRINAQFVGMDNDSFDEQQKKIDAFPLPPSMVMKTQKSYHVRQRRGSRRYRSD